MAWRWRIDIATKLEQTGDNLEQSAGDYSEKMASVRTCALIMGPEGGICCMPALRGGPGSRMLLGPEPGPIPIWPPIM